MVAISTIKCSNSRDCLEVVSQVRMPVTRLGSNHSTNKWNVLEWWLSRQDWKLINTVDPSMYSLALHSERRREGAKGNRPREISPANNRSGRERERERSKEEKDGNEVG